MAAETEQMRARRRDRRVLFDGIADLYQASRPGYPEGLVRFAIDTAGLGPGSAVLEVGCGTGQLTGQLAAHGLAVSAIDIGASMIEAARRGVGLSTVSFEAVSFEEFDAADAAFGLIVSATAFHWVDPEIKFTKSARLREPDGWLALLATWEQYDDPLGAALREMWMARGDDAGAWAWRDTPSETDLTGAAGLFGPPVEKSHSRRIMLPAETVIGLEATRATFLSWPEHRCREFTGELRRRLQARNDVPLTQQSSLVMARVWPRS